MQTATIQNTRKTAGSSLSKRVGEDLEREICIGKAIADLNIGENFRDFPEFRDAQALRIYAGIMIAQGLRLVKKHVYHHQIDEQNLTYTIRRVG
ncbi:MAG: hypothetical protein AABX54_04545 [Nanoarchaeota archaeon]